MRAGIVVSPSEYSWSSYNCNALGIANSLITPHQEYLALGNNAKTSKAEIEDKLLGNIRKNINKGLALGNEAFIKEIEVLTNARVSSRKAGRPKKNVELITL